MAEWVILTCQNSTCPAIGYRWPVAQKESMNETKCPECDVQGKITALNGHVSASKRPKPVKKVPKRVNPEK